MESQQVKSPSYREKLQAERAREAASLPRPEPPQVIVEDDRVGMSVETFKRAIQDNLNYVQGAAEWNATLHDYYMALAYTVRDRLVHRWIKSVESYFQEDAKLVCYLSAEFLIGRQLGSNLLNIGCWSQVRQALQEMGLNIYDLLELEQEPGLGNGGLGRLAACFLDSLATLEIPAIGYGIRYEFGIFEQRIENGCQVEHPDEWLQFGNPWEIHRPRRSVEVKFGGRTEPYHDQNGNYRVRWLPFRTVLGTPYDTMVPGFNTNNVNTLRLWSATSTKDFDFGIFDAGDYARAVAEKTFSENISKVLYPNDNTPQGKELRLQQQYFFVACSLHDILRNFLLSHHDLSQLPRHVAVQLNDTHPAIAVAELMRLLLDEHRMDWNTAWDVTQKTCGFTNHTLLAEALERWPVSLFRRLLPRHLEIIFEINRRFIEHVRIIYPGDTQRVARMSLIEEGPQQRIRMAHLAVVGSHAVNGVAALHTELIKRELLRDFYELWPEKFSSKTNGVTPRRWIMLCNPKLAYLITETIGRNWLCNLDELKQLEPHLHDRVFCETWQIFKEDNKRALAEFIKQKNGITVDSDSLFDIQVKRIHEYKRQLLMVLHIITLYDRLKANPQLDFPPRTFIFGGKAAPGYHMAKLIIRLIHAVADAVNHDPQVKQRLRVVFLENFSVSIGERVYPAADLSEQISMAGKEASGTGNMKFALNGALTIGTLDGANIEIREAVGAENFFLFGHNVEEIRHLRDQGYDPGLYYRQDDELAAAIDRIRTGSLSGGNRDLFEPIVNSLLQNDAYMLMADYRPYLSCQEQVSQQFVDKQQWTRMAILNVARIGRFSSDRTIREYCDEIWDATPVKVALDEHTVEEIQAERFKAGRICPT